MEGFNFFKALGYCNAASVLAPPCRRKRKRRGRREGGPLSPPHNDALNELIVDWADAPVELEFTFDGLARRTVPSLCGESDWSG